MEHQQAITDLNVIKGSQCRGERIGSEKKKILGGIMAKKLSKFSKFWD